MLDMPIRAGRKLQDAAANLREGFSRRADERQQVNSLHRQRMTCSDSMRSFTNTQDWMNGMSISPSGRFQVVEEIRPKQKTFSREGIRWNVAWIILFVVAFLCAAVLTADVAGMGLGSRSIGRLNSKIADLTRRNNELKQEVELNSADVSVCTEAVKLNLISGSGAQTILLTAPQENGAVTAELHSASMGWITGNAGE
jgi:cell division protein FtsL